MIEQGHPEWWNADDEMIHDGVYLLMLHDIWGENHNTDKIVYIWRTMWFLDLHSWSEYIDE